MTTQLTPSPRGQLADQLWADLTRELPASDLERIRGGLDVWAGERAAELAPGQRYMFDLFMPGLPSSPWSDAGEFAFAPLLEEHYDELRGELDDAPSQGPSNAAVRAAARRHTAADRSAWTRGWRRSSCTGEPARCGELRAAASCGGGHGRRFRREPSCRSRSCTSRWSRGRGSPSTLIPSTRWRHATSAYTSRLDVGCVWRVSRGRGSRVGASPSTTAIPTKHGTTTRRSTRIVLAVHGPHPDLSMVEREALAWLAERLLAADRP